MGDRGNTNHRREATRDKARALRDEHRKQERRRRLLLQLSIIGAVIVIAALITVTLLSNQGGSGAGPANMASDGIVIGKDFKAVRTPALTADEQPVATERAKNASVVSIRIYVDYFCPNCRAFENANKAQLTSWLKNGAITLEIHPLALLDRSSLGTAYSSRSANAGACVANYSPDDYWAFTQAMFAKQPAEQTGGLDNAQIIAVIRSAGVHNLSKISDCVNSNKFKNWVAASTGRALTGPLPDSTAKKVLGTPTVIVDGQEYPITTADVTSAAAFAAFVEQAAGAQFDSNGSTSPPTATPTPTSIPIPVPTPTKTK
jgi:protein-disulfide isomerase